MLAIIERLSYTFENYLRDCLSVKQLNSKSIECLKSHLCILDKAGAIHQITISLMRVQRDSHITVNFMYAILK